MMSNKNLFIRAVAFLIAFASIVAVVSCSKEKDNDYDDLYDALSQYYSDTTGDMADEKGNASVEAVVIAPVGCSAEIYDSAKLVAEALFKKTGRDVKVKYDSDYKASGKQIEILVGETDRMASKDFLKSLRVNDYGYCHDGGKLVIAGRTDEGCGKAAKLFASFLESGGIDITNIGKTETNVTRGRYPMGKITLNGFEMSEYSIVYPHENALGEKGVAEKLSQNICYYGGYLLPIVSDKEVTGSTRGICIGKTSISSVSGISDGDRSARIALGEKGHIELLADDVYGLGLACDKLTELIWNGKKDNESNVNVVNTLSISYASASIKTFVVNKAFTNGDLETYRNTVNMINAEKPSVAVFNGCTEDVVKNIESNLGNISSLGERVFYSMADGVRFVDGKITDVNDGAVYILTFETESESSLFRFALVGVIEPSVSGIVEKKQVYERFSVFCMENLQIPIIALFDMPDYLDGMFVKDLDGMERIESKYYINTCGKTFFPGDYKQLEIHSDMKADIVDATAYCKK